MIPFDEDIFDVNQRSTPSNSKGLLELVLSDAIITPLYDSQYYSVNSMMERKVSEKEILWVQPVFAAACSKPAIPQIKSYEITARLTATWIPVDGEPVIISDSVSLFGEASPTTSSPSGATLQSAHTSTIRPVWMLGFEWQSGKLVLNHAGLVSQPGQPIQKINVDSTGIQELLISP